MRVLVTGSDGYIGAVLAPALQAAGYEVTGIDAGFHSACACPAVHSGSVHTLWKDTRDIVLEDLDGLQAVVHLAELSNDPLGEIDPALTEAINFRATARLAQLARRAGVRRFLYFSSCSVYGKASDELCTEASPTHPHTAYARAKCLSEEAILSLAGPDFCPVVLRNATVFGPSPRMRLDLVLNNLAALAFLEGEIRMVSDGSPWRPLIHIRDLCRATRLALEASEEIVRGEVFNCGDTSANYRIREIAACVHEAFPGCRVVSGAPNPDQRSYRVSFEKIRSRLGFEALHTAAEGAGELRSVFERLPLQPFHLEDSLFFRCRRIRQLIAEGRLDEHLRWTALGRAGRQPDRAGAVSPGQR
ncbi:MAG: NAD-dependent epimerase/dehydratase family protein [Bryobacteraceae bacterium]